MTLLFSKISKQRVIGGKTGALPPGGVGWRRGGSSTVCLTLLFLAQRGAGQRLAPGRRHTPGAGHLHGAGRAGQAVRLQNPQLLEPDQVSRVSPTTTTTTTTTTHTLRFGVVHLTGVALF